MKKRNIFNRFVENLKILGKTLGRWGKRAFFGSSKELSLLEEEAVQSPIRVTLNKFFHKKLAIISLTVFVAVFAFCFIGSAFTEGEEMYMDIGQRDTAPGFNMLSVPGELKKNGIKKIATGTTYSAGIDNNGKVFVWGNSLKDLYEGFYKEEKGESNLFYKVDVVTGEYVEVVDSEILNIKKSIKLLNEAGLKAKDVYAGPDSFFIVLEDNTLRGYGLKGDSMSYGSAIITEEIAAQVKTQGVYNITIDNQVTALMTNEKEGSTHKLHIWGNIGLGKNRTQVPSAIIKGIEKAGLNPIDLRWTRDTLVILFDNGTYRAYGADENIAIAAQPSKKVETLTIQIKEAQLALVNQFGDKIPGYSESLDDEAKLAFAAQAMELALETTETKIQVERINKNQEELAINKAYLNDIETVGIKQIRATKGNIIVLLKDGRIITWGDNASKENQIPAEYQGKFVSIQGDTKGAENSSHIVAMTEDGTIVAWGSDAHNATKIPDKVNKEEVAKVYSNYYQNFAVDENGKLVAKWGLSGYTFGTDDSGRSIYLRVMHGGKISLTIGLIAVIISSVIGIIVGGVAGFYGGWVDILMMRLGEIVSSIPFMPIAMTLALVCNELGFRDPEQRMMMIMIILGVLSWPGLASLIRAHILAEREKEFVTAAQAIGVKTNKIIFRHIIPNVITIIIISITSSYASSLLTESGLSFLGFGVEPPTPSWGNMLTGAQNMNVIRQYWWRWVFPSLFLCSATICINLIGDCIRDAIDPRSTER